MGRGISIFSSLKTRRREEEWMDGEGVDEKELVDALKFIRQINSVLGYTRTTLAHLEEFSGNWKAGERITILDVATGSADIPAAILEWARGKGFDVRIVGIDRHERTAAIAAREGDSQRLRIVRADALRLPFAEGSFDYCLTAMFLHHLDDEAIVRSLSEMNRVARRGVIVADLLRDRRALAWIKLFTLFSSPMVKHDAAVSVGQAFREGEVKKLGERAGLGFAKYRRHFGHRFVLAGEKEGAGRSEVS